MKYSSLNLKKITILYVEDEDIIRTNVETCLNYIFNVIPARNGEEGLEEFKNNKIDLIITDINMPVKDGIEMLEEIKKTSPDIPCIITSAYDVNVFNKVKELGISLYLSKPFDIKELLNSSINLLDFQKE